MPARFDLRYMDAAGERRHPVMLHRALYGSLERFLGILLEHHAGALPPWLAPVQAAILPVGAAELPAANALAAELRAAGLRPAVAADESLSRRIAEAHAHAIPFQLVLGAREVAAGTVTLRRADAAQVALPRADAVQQLAQRCARPHITVD